MNLILKRKWPFFWGFILTVNVFFIFLCYKDNVFKTESGPLKFPETKEYRLTSQKNPYFFYQFVFYPETKVSPASSGYFLWDFQEKHDLKRGWYDRLYFASRRMSELIVWGKELPIKGNFRDLSSFGEWWSKTEPDWLSPNKFSNFGSWEAVLARYLKLMAEEVEMMEKRSEKKDEAWLGIFNIVRQHQFNLQYTIMGLTRPENEKKYLLAVSQEIFNFLLGEIGPYLPSHEPAKQVYFPSILLKGDWGNYRLWLDWRGLPQKYADNLVIKYGEKTLIRKETDEGESEVRNYGEILINQDSPPLTMESPPTNLLEDLDLRENVTDPVQVKTVDEKTGKEEISKKELYQYSYTLPPIDVSDKFFLQGNLPLNQSLVVRFEQEYFDEIERVRKMNLMVNETISPNQTNYLRGLGTIPNIPLSGKLIFISLLPLEKEMVKGSFKLLPEFDPVFYLEKINGLPNLNYQKPRVKFVKILWLTLVIIIFLPLIIAHRHLIKGKINVIQKTTKRLLIDYLRVIGKYVSRFRFFWVGAFVLAILTEVFFVRQSFEWLTLGTLIIWLLVVLSGEVPGKISLFCSLVLSGLFIFSQIINGPFTEKAALWAYLFLFIGILQSLKESSVASKKGI